MRRKKFVNTNIICDVCKYQNNPEYVSYSGVCHGCGKILDGRAYFRLKMNKKLRIWRDERSDDWTKGNNKLYNKQTKGTKTKSGV